MPKKMSRETQREKSADILCKNAYRLCKETFGGRNRGKAVDAKTLKEVSAAVKESANVAELVGKQNAGGTARFAVTVEPAAAELAE